MQLLTFQSKESETRAANTGEESPVVWSSFSQFEIASQHESQSLVLDQMRPIFSPFMNDTECFEWPSWDSQRLHNWLNLFGFHEHSNAYAFLFRI